MIEFIDAVGKYSFLQYGLLMGLLASIACGLIGSYVVTRRITYIGGGIAHSVLAGLGGAYYLSVVYKWNALQPLHGAAVTAILAAVIIGLISLKARQREDTVIGAVWAVGMAIGIIFIYQTPGYNQNLMSFLFGNILMVTPSDLWLVGFLDIIVVGLGLLFFNRITAVCFDEEFVRVRGVNSQLYYLLLLILTALTVVILVTVVGIVMVIALLTIPAAVAGLFTKTIGRMMVLASVISAVVVIFGIALSYSFDLPSGAVIILFAGAVYILASLGKRVANI